MELTEKDKNIAWQAYLTLPEWGETGGDGFRYRTVQSQRLFAAVSAVLEMRDRDHEALTDERWKALCDDILDRRGLKWEWGKIDDSVKAEIRAAWSRILYTPAAPETPTEDEVSKAKEDMRQRLVVCDMSDNPHSYAICSCTEGHTNSRLASPPLTPTEPSIPAAAPIDGRYTWAQINDAILKRWDGSEELEHWLKLLAYELGVDPEPEPVPARQSATMNDEVRRLPTTNPLTTPSLLGHSISS